MPVIRSLLSTSTDMFKANAEHMRALVADIADKATTVERGGSEEARKRHTSRGKLLPRQRLASFWMPARPFWRSASLRPGTCMAATSPLPA